MTMEEIMAKVFVNASGLKSLPSAPLMAKTGRKPTTVVATAVSTASGSIEPMSALARRWNIMTMTTSSVTRISWTRASLRVPRVSWISPVRS